MEHHYCAEKEIQFNICRICFCELKMNDAMDLFSDQEESNEILNKIFLCFRLTISYKKYFPCVICKKCINDLEIANQFRLKCSTFEERFLDYCKQLTDVKSNEYAGRTKVPTECEEEAEIRLLPNEPELSPCTEALNDERHIEDISIKKIKKYKSHKSRKKQMINEAKVYTCKTCSRSFKKKSTLLKHNFSMHENRKHVGKVSGYGVTRRYHCTKCSYSTPYSQTLVTHVRRHTGEKPYHCKCGKSFTDLSTFNAHGTIHSSATYYTCSTCGKQFKIAKALKQHLRSHESGRYACDVCNKVLKSRQTLQDHTRRHYNIRNYNCEDCGDTFITSSELIHHRVKHTMDKNFECHLCGYKTVRRRNLVTHLKRHANDRSFKCDQCDASFYSRADVRRHQGVHTKDKSFQCSTCPKAFTRKAALNKHVQSHIIDNKWCDYTPKDSLRIKIEGNEEKSCIKNVLDIKTPDNIVLVKTSN